MLVKGAKENERASIRNKIIHSGIPEYGSIHEPCPHQMGSLTVHNFQRGENLSAQMQRKKTLQLPFKVICTCAWVLQCRFTHYRVDSIAIFTFHFVQIVLVFWCLDIFLVSVVFPTLVPYYFAECNFKSHRPTLVIYGHQYNFILFLISFYDHKIRINLLTVKLNLVPNLHNGT